MEGKIKPAKFWKINKGIFIFDVEIVLKFKVWEIIILYLW